ncbi:hypothetical protein E2C01_083205 [Portunus trituberculatus]|uniref:Uncharacterized protein n=1 Tax=Portunus trituberculatus TaxID=210409 RepID=A0A5B7J764_PORTR|nr:hypothetical protein [Portunus trituberculatus]
MARQEQAAPQRPPLTHDPPAWASGHVGSRSSAQHPVLLAARPSHVWSSATGINIVGYNPRPLCCSSLS